MPPAKVIKLPTVQLIGAQKSGTSAIADWIFEGGFTRPHVFEGEPWFYNKEVHFFDLNHRYSQGVQFYAKRFERAGPEGLTMDATPDTLQFASRVHATYKSAGGSQEKSVRIIVILRDPISRELSLYNHLAFDCRNLSPSERTSWHTQVLKADGSIMTFDEFVLEQSVPAFERLAGLGRSTRHSLYAVHLSQWLQLFDRNQILILSYDELCSQPKKLQQRLISFLGRQIPGEIRNANSNNSELKTKRIRAATKEALLRIVAPHNEELYELLESHPGPPMEQRPFPRFSSTRASKKR